MSGFSGDAGAGDAIAAVKSERIVNGMQFSTVDQDNDKSTGHCAENFNGWWLQRCTISALNLNKKGVWDADSCDLGIKNVVSARMLVKLD